MNTEELANKLIQEFEVFAKVRLSGIQKAWIKDWFNKNVDLNKGLPESIQEALNSGDGTYRP